MRYLLQAQRVRLVDVFPVGVLPRNDLRLGGRAEAEEVEVLLELLEEGPIGGGIDVVVASEPERAR